MLDRSEATSRVTAALRRSQVVLLLGPRQSGKTTLARGFVKPDSPNDLDLESPVDAARLLEPMTALARLRGTVVIDGIQRVPQLFPVLRMLADRKPLPARFLVLGSAAAFRGRSSRAPQRTARRGGRASSPRSSSATCPPSTRASRP